MNSKNDRLGAIEALRKAIEEAASVGAAQLPSGLRGLAPETFRQALHELQGHQAALTKQSATLRREQAELQAEREHYADLYDKAPVGYCTLNEQGLILKANLTAAALLGVAREDLDRQWFSRFVFEPDSDVHYLHQKKLFRAKEPQHYELRVVKADGTVFWARLVANAVQHPGGDYLCHMVLNDFSGEEQAEEALRKSEQTLRAVLDGLAANIALLDAHGLIMLVNQAWRDFAQQNGLAAEPIPEGQNYLHVCDAATGLSSEGAQEFAEGIRGVICGKIQEFTMEYPCDGPDVKRWFIGRVTPFSDVAPRSVIVAHEDISARKLAEEAVVSAGKMDALGVFSGGIAHDFNNILGMISNRATLALLARKSDATLCEHMKQILRATDRGKGLIRQILDYSRPSLGMLVPLDFTAVAESTVSFIKPGLPGNITIRLERPALPLLVQGNATQLTQVMMNLGANAVKAMPLGGSLTLRLVSDKAEDQAVLVVEDTGCGMTDAVRGRIFEPYYTTRNGGHGSGLGLAVVHGIVKNHHGTIRCDSRPGHGACFTFRLPLYHGEDQLVAIAQESFGHVQTSGLNEGRRILFVDDEAELARTSYELLKSFGHQPTVYTNPAMALADFARDPHGVDVIILDMQMPDMDGQELAREMLSHNPDVPIILCTGNSNIISEGQALRLGVRGYLPKPFDWLELDALIDKVSIRSPKPP